MAVTQTFKPHSDKQEAAIFSEEPLTVLCTGIQFGKSTAGALWLKRLLHLSKSKDDNFLVCSPTYKVLYQSTLPPFLKWSRDIGEFRKSTESFHIHNGGTVYFRTGTDPESVVGIPQVKGVWCDEAGLYSLYFWENIQGRAASCDAPIMLTSSPYARNWLYRDIVKPWKEGKLRNALVITAESRENPGFSQKRWDHLQTTMSKLRFRAMFGGVFETMAGLVYDCWHEYENVITPFDLPDGTRNFAGVDWGTSNPFAIAPRSLTPEGDLYQPTEYYKAGLTITDMVREAKILHQKYNFELMYCDPSEPGYILEFTRNGLPAVPAENDIKLGIDTHYELLKTRKLKAFRDCCPKTEDEYTMYHWPEPGDVKPDKDEKEAKPVKQFDHLMDAARYVSMGMRHILGGKFRPRMERQQSSIRPGFIPIDTELAKLKRTPTVYSQTEEW